MYNADKPSPEELPTTAQLIRSTVIAFVAAVIILVTIILPAEYGIDPTRIGGMLGLAQMGEIKQQLAIEAKEDDHGEQGEQSSVLERVFAWVIPSATAQEAWRDEVTFTLQPGEAREFKLVMREGAEAEYLMTVDGGRVNFDLHAHGKGRSVTYERGRGSTGSEGSFVAPFAGDHGWFFRNRDRQAVTVTLMTRGGYDEAKAAN